MRSAAVFLPRGRKMSSLKEYINNQNEPNNHKEKVLTWSRDLTILEHLEHLEVLEALDYRDTLDARYTSGEHIRRRGQIGRIRQR